MLEQYCLSHVVLNEIVPAQFQEIFNYHAQIYAFNEQSQQKFFLEYYRQFQFCKFTFNRICFIELENLLSLIQHQKTTLTLHQVKQFVFGKLQDIYKQYFQVVICDLQEIWLQVENNQVLNVIFLQMTPTNKQLYNNEIQQENNLNRLINDQINRKRSNLGFIFQQTSNEEDYQSAKKQLRILNYVDKELFDEAYEINLKLKDDQLVIIYHQLKSAFLEVKQFLIVYCQQLYNKIPNDQNNISVLKSWLQKFIVEKKTAKEFTLKFILKRGMFKSLHKKQNLENLKQQTKLALHDLIRIHFFSLTQSNKPIKLCFEWSQSPQQGFHEKVQSTLENLLRQKIIYLENLDDQVFKELIPIFQELQKQNSQQTPNLLIFKILQLELKENLFLEQDEQRTMKIVKKFLRNIIYQFIEQYFQYKWIDLESFIIIQPLLKMQLKNNQQFNFKKEFYSIVTVTFQKLKIKIYDKEIVLYNQDYIKYAFLDLLNCKIKQKDHKLKNINLADELSQENNFKEGKYLISKLFTFLLQYLNFPLEKLSYIVTKNLQQCIDCQKIPKINDQLIQDTIYLVTQEVTNSLFSQL